MTTNLKTFSWAETQMAKLILQLENIGVQLGSLGPSLGVSLANITLWQQSAAAIAWANDALPIVRNYSTAMTNWRDAMLLDKVAVARPLPELALPPQTPLAAAAFDNPAFVSDFLDWADKIVDSIKQSPNYNSSIEAQLGLLKPPAPPAPGTLRPTIKSFHDGPKGLVEFTVDRQNQPMILVTVTLSDGRIFTNRLPSAKIPVNLPDDRPYSFSAVAQYTDKMGEPYGLISQPLTGTSDVSN